MENGTTLRVGVVIFCYLLSAVLVHGDAAGIERARWGQGAVLPNTVARMGVACRGTIQDSVEEGEKEAQERKVQGGGNEIE